MQSKSDGRIRVKCPFCGYKMPVELDPDAECRGVWMKCKGRSCGKKFEIVIINKDK